MVRKLMIGFMVLANVIFGVKCETMSTTSQENEDEFLTIAPEEKEDDLLADGLMQKLQQLVVKQGVDLSNKTQTQMLNALENVITESHNPAAKKHLLGGSLEGLYEHDSSMIQIRLNDKNRKMQEPSKLWKNGIVPYVILDKSRTKKPLTRHQKRLLEKTIRFFESKTCLTFPKWYKGFNKDHNRDVDGYLRFFQGDGCFSGVGNWKSKYGQPISPCDHMSTVMHEIGHAIGMEHEQSRLDRDRYLKVYPENSKLTMNKHGAADTIFDLSAPYDMSSIMQYGLWDFSKNGKIVYDPKDKSQRYLIKNNDVVTFYDRMSINAAYQCIELKCPDAKKLKCNNEGFFGYEENTCRCICPEGLMGPTCDELYKPRKMPAKWPKGSYGLPMTEEKCIDETWMTGSLKEHIVKRTAPEEKLDELDGDDEPQFVNVYARSKFTPWRYCMAGDLKIDSSYDWPPGFYCIYKYGGDCPSGFSKGNLQFGNTDKTGEGAIPDGQQLNSTVQIQFCCRSDGIFTSDRILLPRQKPFFLFQKSSECQQVEGMHVKSDYHDFANKNYSISGSHPYITTWRNKLQLYHCSYVPFDNECGGMIDLTKEQREHRITSPGYPNQLGKHMNCLWFIKGAEHSIIRADIDLLNLERDSSGKCTENYLEIKRHRIAQPGTRYCGNMQVMKSFVTTTNYLMVRLSTFGDADNNRGFSMRVRQLTAENDFCYNYHDSGASYRGTVNLTQSYMPCLSWDKVTHCPYHTFIPTGFYSGLEGNNYCRNPGNLPAPWCYIQAEDCKQDLCDACQFRKCLDLWDNCEELKGDVDYCTLDPTAKIGCRRSCNLCRTEKSRKLTEIRCKRPAIPNDNTRYILPIKNLYSVGEKIFYKCVKGDGHYKQICLSDGTWSWTDTICSECAAGFHQIGRNCYRIATDYGMVLIDEAESICAAMGYHLVTIDSKEKMDEVRKVMTNDRSTAEAYFIGLKRTASNSKTFRWMDGSPDNGYENWMRGQPNNFNGQQDCVQIYRANGLWNDVPCSYSRHFICGGLAAKNEGTCEDTLKNCPEFLSKNPDTCIKHPEFANVKCRESCGFCINELKDRITCSQAGQGNDAKLLNETITTFRIGQTIVFECNDGYKLTSGDLFRVCLPNGKFSGEIPTCKDEKSVPFVVGSLVTARRYRNSPGAAFVDTTNRIVNEGKIVSWTFYSATDGDIFLQIWRENSNGSFTLVGQNKIQTYRNRKMTVHVHEDEQIYAQKDNVIGFFSMNGSGSSISYDACVNEFVSNFKPHIYSMDYFNAGRPMVVETPFKFTLIGGACRNYSLQAKVIPGVVKMSCSIGPAPTNAQVNVTGTVDVGARILYSCKDYYRKMRGNILRICKTGGILSGTPIACEYMNPLSNEWILFGKRFYKPVIAAVTWEQATGLCAIENAFLTTVINDKLIFKLKTRHLHAGRYWTSARGDGNRLSLSDSSALEYSQWENDVPMHFPNTSCVTINHQGKLSAELCTSNAGYICEKRHVCPFGFVRKGRDCFLVIRQNATWLEAEGYCPAFNGYLATIRNQGEHEFVKRLAHDESVWIGLNDRVKEGVWKWTDGSPVNYTNWGSYWNSYPQPTPTGPLTGDCVVLSKEGWMDFKWDDISCSKRRSFVCRTTLPIEEKMTDKNQYCFEADSNHPKYHGRHHLTRSGLHCQRWDSQFPQRHSYFRKDSDFKADYSVSAAADYCRQFMRQTKVWCYTTSKKRWETCNMLNCVDTKAKRFCHHPALYANVTIIEGKTVYEEGESAKMTCKDGYYLFGAAHENLTCAGDNLWEGEHLRCMGIEMFSCEVSSIPDSTPSTNERVWIGKTVKYTCNQYHIYVGGDQVRKCGKSRQLLGNPIICEDMPERCPSGWVVIGGRCTLIDPTKRTWIEADEFCANNSAFLVKIPDENTNKEIKKYLSKIRSNSQSISRFWTGAIGQARKLVYLDESSMTFFGKWIKKPEDGLANKALAVDVDGKWIVAKRRHSQYGSICQMPPSCPVGFTSRGTTCYKLYTEEKMWAEAEAVCVKYGGHLLTIPDGVSNEFFKSIARKLGKSVWIGFNDRVKESNFVWTSEKATGFTDWGLYWGHYQQPHTSGALSGDCVVLSNANSMNYTWDDIRCNKNRSFICEIKHPFDESESNLDEYCVRAGEMPRPYRGHLSHTKNGYSCQRWSEEYPHKKSRTRLIDSNYADGSKMAAADYCRAFPKSKNPWCYTLDKKKRFDYCDPVTCESGMSYCHPPPVHRNVALEPRKLVYRYGDQVRASCKFNGTLHGGSTLRCHGNNIWSGLSQRCTYTDGDQRRINCILPNDEDASEFIGTNDVTIDGYICQRWDSQYPHKHTRTDKSFPLDGSAKAASNYCRSVTESRPWCYTLDSKVRWQFCDVPVCEIPTCRVPQFANVTTTAAENKQLILEGDDVTMTCQNGFFPDDDSAKTIQCNGSGLFSGKPRRCMGSDMFTCVVDVPSGSVANTSGRVWIGTSVKYSCKQYQLYIGGDEIRNCEKSSLKLSGTPIICREMPERCPPGWVMIGQHCVIADFTPQTWLEADKTCADEGAFLVKINDDKQNEDLAQYISDLKNKKNTKFVVNGFWIGAHGQVVSSTSELVYADGSALGFTKWSKPPSAGTANKAVVIDYDGNWSQEKRSHGNGAICQLPISCPGGFSSRRNTCYKIFTTAKNWMESEKTCVKYGGHLLTIVDSEQNEFYKTIAQNYGNSVWIGFNDIEKEGDFVWSSNTDVVYTNWGKYWGSYAQPWTRGKLAGDCVVLSKEGKMKYTWDDISCEMKRAFICEIPHPIQEAAPSGCTSPPLHYNVIQQSQQKRDYGIDESVEVKCAHGGTLVGDVKIICYGKNIWSSLSQSCTFDEKEKRRKDCVLPTDPNFSKFNGTNSITSDGYICQRWDSQKPHSHSQTDKDFPLDGSATAANNFCRPVGGESKPWCYTTNPNIEKQTCDIPVCDIPTCRVPDISNVEIAGGKTIVLAGEEVQMVCKDGYFPEENTGDKLTCTENRAFTGEHRVCRGSSAFSCPIDIPRGSKTNVTGSVWVKDSVEYSCKQYKMYKGGDKRRKCGKPPTLSGKPIICEEMPERCPPGWAVIGQHCVIVDFTPQTWLEADKTCADEGAFLVKINDDKQNEDLAQYISDLKNKMKNQLVINGFWIGAHGQVFSSTSELVYADGSALGFTKWSKPPSAGTANKAVVIDYDGNWSQEKRSKGNGAICQLPISCPGGFSSRRNTCYKIFTTAKNWMESENTCVKYGGHLLTIVDSEQNEFYKTIAQNYGNSVWIGFNDIEKEGDFVWSSNNDVVYTNWGKYWGRYAQPWTRGTLAGDCVVLSKEGKMKYTWDDISCEMKRAFICEIPHPIQEAAPSGCTSPPLHYNVIQQSQQKRDYGIDESVEVKCAHGGTLVGDVKIICYGKNIWSSLSQSCTFDEKEKRRKDCVLPTDPDFSKFNGTNSITSDGYICQRWDSQKPHSHSQTDKDFPLDGSATAANNFCRPVGGEYKPWCYTTNPNIEKQTCDIPVCDIPTCRVPDISNVEIAGGKTIVLAGEEVQMVCKDGYFPEENTGDKLTCTENRVFTGEHRVCRGSSAFSCTIDIPRGSKTNVTGSVWVEDSVEYSCKQYQMYKGGDKRRKCEKPPTLSGKPIICEDMANRCPAGWVVIGDYCMTADITKHDWVDAEELCAQKGGFLAKITDGQMNSNLKAYIKNQVSASSVNGFWIGAHGEVQSLTTSILVFMDSSPITYANWLQAPTGGLANKAVVIDKQGKWILTKRTSETFGAICQLPINCPDGFTARGRMCHKVFTEKKNWNAAETVCSSYGGHLITILDTKTNEFYKSIARKLDSSVWIGLNDITKESIFRWTSGKTFEFSDWGKYWKTYQQPWARGSLSGDCVVLSKEGKMRYRWDDVKCTEERSFICELAHPVAKDSSPSICQYPPLHYNAILQTKKRIFDVGETVRLACRNYGTVMWEKSITCYGNDIWSSLSHRCNYTLEQKLKTCVLPTDPNFSKFNGTNSITSDGYICQRWDSQKPHSHSQTDKDFPLDGSATAADNFCRPVGGESKPWCYTTNPNIEKQTCDIPVCDIPTCQVPSAANITVAENDVIVLEGEKITVRCDKGFHPVDDIMETELTCLGTGNFLGKMIKCLGPDMFQCKIDVLPHSQTSMSGTVWVGKSVNYKCHSYYLYKGGDRVRTCQKESLKLSGTPLICEEDPDRCPPGWALVAERCIIIISNPQSYAAADLACAGKGSFLMTIPNSEIQSEVDSYLSTHTNQNAIGGYWTGGHAEGGKWSWADDVAIAYTNWKVKPSGQIANKAIAVDNTGKWMAVSTNANNMAAICQLPAVACPGGFTDYGSVCYKLFTAMKDFALADETCQMYGGHLASIPDSKTNELYKNVAKDSGQSVWIGANDRATEGDFVWTSGKTLQFTDWGKYWKTYQQPWTSGSLSGDCVVLSKEGWMKYAWDDISCASKEAFICEIPRPTEGSEEICGRPSLHFNIVSNSEKTVFEIGESVKFSCKTGNLVGDQSLVCNGGNIWLGIPPTCH